MSLSDSHPTCMSTSPQPSGPQRGILFSLVDTPIHSSNLSRPQTKSPNQSPQTSQLSTNTQRHHASQQTSNGQRSSSTMSQLESPATTDRGLPINVMKHW